MMLNGWGYLNYKREFVPVYCFWRSEYDFGYTVAILQLRRLLQWSVAVSLAAMR